MPPGRYDLLLYRGDSYLWRYQLWSDCARTEPVDLTGATVAASMGDKPGGLELVALDCEITLPNIIDVAMHAGAWTGVGALGAWDLEVTYDGGAVRTIVSGRVAVTEDVTNPAVTAGVEA